MDSNKEEELQRQAEKNQISGHNVDSRAYLVIFNALRREPEFRLSAKFSEAVLDRISEAESRSLYYWVAFVMLGFIIAAGAAIVLTGFKPDFGFLKHISRFTGLFVFGAGFILFLQWIDRKLVHQKTAGI
jgi:hypothetical protein